MTFDEFYNEPKNEKILNILAKKMYYSNRGYFIRKHMEYDEFLNEIIIRLLKYWGYYQNEYKLSVNTFIDNVIYRTVNNLYETMDAQKRKINYDEGLERIDKERGEDEAEIVLRATEYNPFNEETVIELITEKIDNQIDKKICSLHLQGISQTKICELTGFTRRQVEYRINSKYRKLFIETYNEYKNNLVY